MHGAMPGSNVQGSNVRLVFFSNFVLSYLARHYECVIAITRRQEKRERETNE